MAKELPYFKFEPAEWLEGNIQICSDMTISCFINIMSAYWSKLGCMTYAFALHKHCRKDESVLQELKNNQIITVEDGYILIEFLDEQLAEFKETSNKRRKAAEKRWSNASAYTSAMQVHSKSNAIREEKIREEKIREEKIREEKIREEKIREDDTLPDFETLWKIYPKKDGKKKALSAYKASLKKNSHQDIKNALNNYLKKIEVEKTEHKYIKNGSTFFNNWEDFIDYKPVAFKQQNRTGGISAETNKYDAIKVERM